jgi:hypothetical protein
MRAALSFICLVLLMPGSSAASPISTSGAVVLIAPPPAVPANDLQSDSEIFGFVESERIGSPKGSSTSDNPWI